MRLILHWLCRQHGWGRVPKGQNRTRRDDQEWYSGWGGSSAISNASRIEFFLYEGFCSGQAIFGDDAKNIAGEWHPVAFN